MPEAATTGTYYTDESVTLHNGDALEVLRTLAAGSVDCIVTSPPYYRQRDYGVEGQYGLESTLGEYVETMRAVFAEARRVLADDGTFWLNLGDTYAAKPAGGRGRTSAFVLGNRSIAAHQKGGQHVRELPDKNLCGVPWRVALALQADGWFLRQEVIWSKRSCMPEAVTDRPSRSHEQVFLFSKRARYWFDADAIREDSDPEQVAHNERYARVYAAQADRAATTGQPGNVNSAGIHSRPGRPGRNARSVWSMSTQPFPGAHYATFPVELPTRCIKAGCKPAGTVLDPFSGSGTTGLAAERLGRRYVGIDLDPKSLDLSLATRLAQGGFVMENEPEVVSDAS